MLPRPLPAIWQFVYNVYWGLHLTLNTSSFIRIIFSVVIISIEDSYIFGCKHWKTHIGQNILQENKDLKVKADNKINWDNEDNKLFPLTWLPATLLTSFTWPLKPGTTRLHFSLFTSFADISYRSLSLILSLSLFLCMKALEGLGRFVASPRSSHICTNHQQHGPLSQYPEITPLISAV